MARGTTIAPPTTSGIAQAAPASTQPIAVNGVEPEEARGVCRLDGGGVCMHPSWRRGSWGLGGVSALLWLAACARNPMPASLTFEGRKLELASEWSRGGLRGVVFVPPGQKLP